MAWLTPFAPPPQTHIRSRTRAVVRIVRQLDALIIAERVVVAHDEAVVLLLAICQEVVQGGVQRARRSERAGGGRVSV